jgi:predicted house-cleaning noncanonical NTP pyrophosphatase (MazG superfamily)
MTDDNNYRVYNKLVRDKIPELIDANGQTGDFFVYPADDYENEVILKVGEESGEYLENKNPEELADILELLMELARIRNIPFAEIEAIRQKKLKERGGFSKRIFLVKVKEK